MEPVEIERCSIALRRSQMEVEDQSTRSVAYHVDFDGGSVVCEAWRIMWILTAAR